MEMEVAVVSLKQMYQCPHGLQRSRCILCGGTKQIKAKCIHGRQRTYCVDCGRSKYQYLCPHQKQKPNCFGCRKSYSCPHYRQRSKCPDTLCGGTREKRRLCAHGKQQCFCIECGNQKYLNPRIFCSHRTPRQICKKCNLSGYTRDTMIKGLKQLIKPGLDSSKFCSVLSSFRY